jgi:DNA polymerase-3 subunit delta
MQIKYSALAANLRTRQFTAVYVLTGDDIYLTNQSAHSIKTAWCNTENDSTTTQVHLEQPTDWQTLIDHANHYSLFADQQLIEARYDKKTIDVVGKKVLQHYVTHPNASCLIIIRAPLLKPAQYSSFANLTVVQHTSLTAAGLQQWLQSELKKIPLLFTPAILDLILRHTTGNQLACAQLIEKLKLIYEPGETIQLHDIQAHLIDQSDYQLSELSDAWLRGDLATALRVLQQTARNRTEITLVLWIITQDIRRLIQLHHYQQQGTPFNTACQQLSIWAQKANGYALALKRITLTQLTQLLMSMQQLDVAIKSGSANQPWQNIEQLMLQMQG